MKERINQQERAYLAWPVLVAAAKRQITITYKQLALALNIHPRAVRFVLGEIQEYCLTVGLPPLTVVVVNQHSGAPGQGFIAGSLNSLNEVFEENWQQHENPFEFAKNGQTIEGLVNRLYSHPRSAQDVFAIVKVRGQAQRVFRSLMLKIYAGSCTFCGFSVPEALEAAHIKPWAFCEPSEKLEVSNGMLLCATHHRLFDSRIISVAEDYTIKVKSNFSQQPIDKAMIENLHGEKLHLPSRVQDYPSKELLANRNLELHQGKDETVVHK